MLLPAPQTRATIAANPATRCLAMLARLAATSTAYVKRLWAYRQRTANPRGRRRANGLLYRLYRARAHLRILTGKLAANPAYRGEPPRPRRRPAAAPPRAARQQPHRRAKPRPYEQVFAGRSVGQIVDRIRRDLGRQGRIGPHLDELLARHPSPPDPLPSRRQPRPRHRPPPRRLQRARTPLPARVAAAARSPPRA